jgi:2-polyprenyl-6-hydroxyphenyl methylase/3-demethylubiquinone-9 3-methyltransferase
MLTSIEPEEVEKFSAIADQWWLPQGKFKLLHKFNPVRLSFLKYMICSHFNLNLESKQPLQGITILDVGCGGGLIAEPLARLGAEVTAIDASPQNIKVASLHAESNNLKINYQNIALEELVVKSPSFDVVLNLEIIEHVVNPENFLHNSAKLVSSNGLLFVASINRTYKALLLAKYAAEYILNFVPHGTHDWKKFLKPSEITKILTHVGLLHISSKGVKLNLLKNDWQLTDNLQMNYILSYHKKN